jgi:2-polyprenyl-3-methyl-5-hydroxy-6-metoxy-1,4-benzoquinol methylase
MVKIRKRCRVCGGSRIVFAFELGPYHIIKCRGCGFGWTEPLPSEEEIAQVYQELYKDCVDSPDAEAISNAFKPERENAIRTISRLCPAWGNFLDVGCGLGEILDIARRYGFRTFGVELNASRAAEAAKKGHNIQVGVFSPSTFEGVQFDVVILSHIIEHLRNPEELICQVRERIRKNGLLYIATPNFGGMICAIEGSRYKSFTPPVHIAYFTRPSLKRLLENCGFCIVKERTFTSYYLHTKDLSGYFLKLRFLRKAKYRDPRTQKSVKRFVEGRFHFARTIIYALLIAVSRLITPTINALGGEHLQTYWRKR